MKNTLLFMIESVPLIGSIWRWLDVSGNSHSETIGGFPPREKLPFKIVMSDLFRNHQNCNLER
jgi:hypothetical protein